MNRCLVLSLAAFLAAPSPIRAQIRVPADSAVAGPPLPSPQATPGVEYDQVPVAPPVSNKAAPLIAPMPFYNSMLEFGVIGMVGVMKRLGPTPATPPSSFGLFGMATTNGTWGLGLGTRAYLAEDAWRITTGGGYFDVRFDYFGIGGTSDVSVKLRETIAAFRLEPLRRVTKGLYLGARVQYADISVGVAGDTLAPPFPPYDVDPRDSDELLLAPVLELDTRDDQYYPTRGWHVNASASFLSDQLASDSTMQQYEVLTAWQHGWDEGKNVVAAAFQGCYSTGQVPINHLCFVGAQGGLRGYEPARYLDRTQVTVQAEYRRRFGRAGLAAFAGVAQIASSPGKLSTDDLLPAAGVGVRMRLTKQFPVNYRADVAYGKDGVQLYFAVGEAF